MSLWKSNLALPRLAEVEQRLYSRRPGDIGRAVEAAWKGAGLSRRVRRGDRVGITVGSRGIDNIAAIVRSAADLVKQAGGKPFIIPAMGSHGGATAAGQTALLKSLGVTAQSAGAPIRAAMEAVKVGATRSGTAIYAGREAAQADGVIVMNRIKQHTDFVGEHESGLVKMLAIGVGKRDGAVAMHSRGCASLREDVPEAARVLIARLPVLGGLAILENGYHETADIVGIPAGEILEREKALLRRVRRNAAGIPFPEVDLLIVDRIGKDISGVGFDTHVIARRMVWGEPEFRGPRIHVVAARDVSEASHGNALGMGLADLVTERLASKIDWDAVKTNVLHTGFLNRAKLPIVLPNDRELVAAAMFTLGEPDAKRVRVVRIPDTLRLRRMWVSEGLLGEARANARIEVLGKPAAMAFDRSGNLKEQLRASR
jgi:hypothetical protein